jgi:hypothetical protein
MPGTMKLHSAPAPYTLSALSEPLPVHRDDGELVPADVEELAV